MSVTASAPDVHASRTECAGCNGTKNAPLATVVTLSRAHITGDLADWVHFSLCEECGRDVANAIGFMCIKEGGWSKLEPRRKRRSE